jgi:hypothetical protein
MIGVGTRVLLKVCCHGEPGTVVRIERNRATVFWHGLDYLAKHHPESLLEALQKRLQSADETEMDLQINRLSAVDPSPIERRTGLKRPKILRT